MARQLTNARDTYHEYGSRCAKCGKMFGWKVPVELLPLVRSDQMRIRKMYCVICDQAIWFRTNKAQAEHDDKRQYKWKWRCDEFGNMRE